MDGDIQTMDEVRCEPKTRYYSAVNVGNWINPRFGVLFGASESLAYLVCFVSSMEQCSRKRPLLYHLWFVG